MKFSTIVIVALVASSVLAAAGDENCKDHPWAKRDLLKKVGAKLFEGWTDGEADWKTVMDAFASTTTATDLTTLTATAHPRVPAAWITSDVTTCCTPAVYTALNAIPASIISMLQARPSRFERGLAAFPKILAKCGRKMRKKGAKAKKGDGESADGERTVGPDFLKMTIRQILKKLAARARTAADGEKAIVIDSSILPSASSTTQEDLEKREYKGAIELMKLFFQGKAAVWEQWINFQRGQLMFLCRKPSLAKDSLAAKAATGAPKVSLESDTETQKGMKAGMGRILVAVKKLAGALKHAFKVFGGPKCAKGPATGYIKKLLGSVGKRCGEKGACKDAKFAFRVLSFGLLSDLISKTPKDKTDQGTGRLDDRGDATPVEHSRPPMSSSSARLLRTLVETDAAAGDEATVAATGDADAIPNSSNTAQPVTFGGVDADGTCTGDSCDYDAEEEQYDENGTLTEDGITASESDADAASGTLITAVFAVIALITLF